MFGDGNSFGGAERYCLELARATAAFTPVRLVAFGPSAGRRRLGDLDVRIERERWNVAGRPHDPLNLAFLRHCLWADVIHCHQARSTMTALATVCGRLTRKRIFVTDHGGGGSNVVRRLRIGRWFNAQLSQSEFAAKSIPHIGRQIEIIYGGVDPEKYKPSTEKIPRQLLYLGRLLPHKGIEHLIEAIPCQARLKIVGRPLDSAYLTFLKHIAQERDVEFCTTTEDEEVIRLLSSSQCLVLPSVYKDYRGRKQALPELLGLVLLEAMACGTAVVCTNVGGMPEIVTHAKTGFIVVPGSSNALRDVLHPLVEKPKLARLMGQNARKDVMQRFTWKGVAQTCLDLY